jgi:hypothetical protein
MANPTLPLQAVDTNAVGSSHSGNRTTAVKRLEIGSRVSGAVGEFITNHDGSKRRRLRERWFGHILSAVGTGKYLVRFDNGQEKECSSQVLRKEARAAALPPDVPVPQNPNTIRQRIEEDTNVDIDVNIENQDEEEHLPQALPDAEEQEDTPDDQENEEPAPTPTAPRDPDGRMQPEPETQPAPATAAPAPAAPHDPNGRMPGQLPTATEVLQNDYHSIKQRALAKVAAMVGQEVTITASQNRSMTWKVVESLEPDTEDILPESNQGVEYGLMGFVSHAYYKTEVFAKMFLRLTFKDWKENVKKLNQAIENSKARVKHFTNKEFLSALGLLIGAADFSQVGKKLFSTNDKKQADCWESLTPHPHFERILPYSRLKDFRNSFRKSLWMSPEKRMIHGSGSAQQSTNSMI